MNAGQGACNHDVEGDHAAVNRRGGAGRWVVVGILLLGCLAGVIAVSYWSAVGRPDGADQVDGAGSVAWDEQAAIAELSGVQEQFNVAAVDGKPVEGVLAAAVRFAEKYPRVPEGRTLLAQIYLYQGQPRKALDELRLSLELDPRQAEVHLLAGTVAMSLADQEAAVHHYSMAVGLESAQPRYHLHLAQAYLGQGEHDKARRLLMQVLQLDSGSHAAHAMLSGMYAGQNKLGLALDQIGKAIERTPVSDLPTRMAYVQRQARLLRRDNRPEEALLVLDTLGPRGRSEPMVLEETALCWAMMGKPDRAAGVYEDALKGDPAAWQYAAAAGMWRIKAGDTDAAMTHLELLRKINPRAEAIGVLEDALRVEPGLMSER